MFGANLRQLAADHPSISELARKLGINRTQFNRYLSGESFPRPDVLARICRFFQIDARVLLEPVTEISLNQDPINNRFLRDFLGTGVQNVPEADFPSGFYRFAWHGTAATPSYADMKAPGHCVSRGCPPVLQHGNTAGSYHSRKTAFLLWFRAAGR